MAGSSMAEGMAIHDDGGRTNTDTTTTTIVINHGNDIDVEAEVVLPNQAGAPPGILDFALSLVGFPRIPGFGCCCGFMALVDSIDFCLDLYIAFREITAAPSCGDDDNDNNDQPFAASPTATTRGWAVLLLVGTLLAGSLRAVYGLLYPFVDDKRKKEVLYSMVGLAAVGLEDFATLVYVISKARAHGSILYCTYEEMSAFFLTNLVLPMYGLSLTRTKNFQAMKEEVSLRTYKLFSAVHIISHVLFWITVFPLGWGWVSIHKDNQETLDRSGSIVVPGYFINAGFLLWMLNRWTKKVVEWPDGGSQQPMVVVASPPQPEPQQQLS